MIRIRSLVALCALSLMGCALQSGDTPTSSTAALAMDDTPGGGDDATHKGAPSGTPSADGDGDDPSQPHPSPWSPPGEAESEPHPSPWNPNETHVANAARSVR